MEKRWIYNELDLSNLSNEFDNLSVNALQILHNRNINSAEKILKFFSYDFENFNDTKMMKDSLKAVNLIKKALKDKWKIVVYLDYDADGTTSAIVAYLALTNLGANVSYYSNNRFEDGYGICKNGVDKILSIWDDTQLIITVDNGIVAYDACKYVKTKNINLIITDHHEANSNLPMADAIVNPKRKDDNYPFKGLCGCGVIYKLMLLLYDELNISRDFLYELLDVVALGTVGDIVPLVDENRIFVKKGIELIQEGRRPVFKYLNESYGVKKVTSHETLAFKYTPFVNALSRMTGTTIPIIDLFLEKDEYKIKELITKYKEINEERKRLTEEQLEIVENILENKGIKEVIVIAEEWLHEGSLGLVAGKLKEKYNRPTFILSIEDGMAKGSARSIDGFNLKEQMDSISYLFEKYGGHAAAAGLSLRIENLKEFEDLMLKSAQKTLTDDDYIIKVNIDCELNPASLTETFINEIDILEPFGASFEPPVIAMNFIVQKSPSYIGENQKHLKLSTDNNISILLWNQSFRYQKLNEPKYLKALGSPNMNIFNNEKQLQFIVDNDNWVYK
ncbi:MAG: single-stranded-DNA-specific exonuclease RecJ [Romboutsia sp.]|nr:single-stranded-DNA-specific exonuclease RecJ [Romboutsia sp.]